MAAGKLNGKIPPHIQKKIAREDRARGAKHRHCEPRRIRNDLSDRKYRKLYRETNTVKVYARNLKDFNEGVSVPFGKLHHNVKDESALTPLELLILKEERTHGNSSP